MGLINLDIFYELTAIHEYNSERKGLTQPLIKQFLCESNDNFNIFENIGSNSVSDTPNNSETEILKMLFQQQDNLITSNLSIENVLKYIFLRYGSYEDIFLEKYNISLHVFVAISTIIFTTYTNRLSQSSCLKPYQFTTKEEYLNKNFIALPDDEYIDEWKNTSTFNYDELFEIIVQTEKLAELTSSLTRDEFDTYLELYAFNLDRIKTEPDLRFREYPLFCYKDKIILINPLALIQYLPHKMDYLLQKTKKYRASKGKEFENIIFNLLEEIPAKKMIYENIEYEEFELDCLLNLRRSSWFIECKSRNISSESLKGKRNKIQKDIKRAIKEGIEQGERDIAYKNSKDMKKYGVKNICGIIVVIEGIFPNIRVKPLLPNNALDNCKHPVCVFNYFDLRTILNQPDAHLFEDFLIWRSQKNMPIWALDECDYWAFYTRMRNDKHLKEMFKEAQEKNVFVPYISERFNDKTHVSKLIMEDT
ncbi:hypothetical protein [Methanolobus vulcani]|uniref:Nuclease-related domain-containing protein n=1 Tax=Methanolobus vulcani TaxID=38026 RepID=A0A7Z8KMF2_9EURY|nr:hypothetical protein [Methanolobus vulcani]TQD23503.1 hypothetical protein FKV42_13340 [Methanolobus vulcani]